MKVPMNDLARAIARQASDLDEVVGSVLRRGWLVHGPEHAAFEVALAEFVGVGRAVGVASGTDALELAIRAVAERPSGVVVNVANAGGYASIAALRAGFEVRFCDVDPETHCIDVASLEQALSADVVAVVITHLYGRMAAVESACEIATARGVPVIEDCAQAIGAQRGGRRAGSFGRAGAFSFYPTKNLGALGDGGAVVTDDDGIAERVRLLRQYGWNEKYRISLDGGRNSRLDELQAAVLRYRLPQVDDWNARRRSLIRRYLEAANEDVRVLEACGSDHAAHLAVVETPDASALARHLRSCGIASEVHYPIPDHRQHALIGFSPAALPVTESLVGRILSIPCFPELADTEVERIQDALQSFTCPRSR